MGFLLLVRLLVGMGICNDTNTLNRAESTKLLLQIMLIGIIAESCDDQGLEGVATDIGIFGRFIM